MIVSLADADAPDVKAFLLNDLKIADAELERRIAAVRARAARTAPTGAAAAAHGDGGGGGGGGGGKLVKVAFARNQAEAEMLQGLLLESGIPSVLKRSRRLRRPRVPRRRPARHLVDSDQAREGARSCSPTRSPRPSRRSGRS